MKLITPLLIVACVLLLSSCSKSYDQLPANSKYLTGNGSNYYIPLAIDNSWSYTPGWKSVITAKSGTSYTMLDNGVPATIWIDSTGAYVMRYNDAPLLSQGIRTLYNGSVPFVYIPATPVVGQTWTGDIETGMRLTTQVLSTNATIATNICAYTNCLEMSYTYDYTDYNGKPGSVTWTKYFKKGVGEVYANSIVNEGVGNTYALKDFILN